MTGPGPGDTGRPPVLVRRRGLLLGGVGLAAASVSAAYLSRAVATSSVLDWAVTGVLAGLALAFLAAAVDARSPLLVADEDGVRVRRGRTWTAWRWAEVADVQIRPTARWRDGGLEVRGQGDDVVRLRLGLATGVDAAGDPAAAIAALRDPGSTAEVTPVDGPHPDHADSCEPATSPARPGHPSHWRDPRPALASGIAALADRIPARGVRLPVLARHRDPLADGPTGGPTDGSAHTRVDGALALEAEATVALVLPERDELHRSDDLGDLFGPPQAAPAPAADDQELTEAIVLPVADPVIGPRLAQARARLGLRVDELSERTRIRPRVIEAIENDDFAACGGDFYARGHLRTLARVLRLDAAPLLADYDDRYAAAPAATAAPAAARLAELPVHEPSPPRESPRWSVIVAAVMAVVLAWSVARLALDAPTLQDRVPGLGAGSGGVHAAGVAGKAVPVLLRAGGGGAHVVVRDGNGKIAFTGDLAFGESRRLDVIPPIRLDSSDGGVEVIVSGTDHGRLGDLGRPASGLFDGG